MDCNPPRESDNIIDSRGFKLYLASDTYAYLSEISEILRIDYVESPKYSGFRLSLPQKTITMVSENKPIPQTTGIRLRRLVFAGLIIIVLVVGVAMGWVGSMSLAPRTSQTAPSKPVIISLIVIPDWGGATYDAFIVPANANGTVPKPGTNATGPAGWPGPNNNNVSVPVNVPVTFVITNLDTALNLNYTANATLPFTIYNDTASGQVPVKYNLGQPVRLAVSHTFIVTGTNVNVPLPPDTIVTFTTTFTTTGRYLYFCSAPCGLGMGLMGYMDGYINAS